jgi:uncharacterized LabA/DUF88 family protein
MDRAGIFVDAGYLFAQGSVLLAGRKLRRSETRLDEAKALAFFEGVAKACTGLPLLRIYWYDGTDSGPTAAHVSLAYQPNVKMRLGIVNAFGEQKGVDSLIVTDLINLSRNGAMSDAILLTGDEDIRVGVQQAQEFGVRVHLVGLEPAKDNQSNLLRQEADTVHEITKAELQAFLFRAAPPVMATVPVLPAEATQPGASPLVAMAEAMAHKLVKDDAVRVASSATRVPPDIDRELLQAGAATVNGSLNVQQKREMRRAFINACKART